MDADCDNFSVISMKLWKCNPTSFPCPADPCNLRSTGRCHAWNCLPRNHRQNNVRAQGRRQSPDSCRTNNKLRWLCICAKINKSAATPHHYSFTWETGCCSLSQSRSVEQRTRSQQIFRQLSEGSRKGKGLHNLYSRSFPPLKNKNI